MGGAQRAARRRAARWAEHKKHDSGARRQRWVEGGGLSNG